MSIKSHLLPDEDVLEYCATKYWMWVCTDRRVLKYKQTKSGAEALHDLSFGEIAGVSLVNTGRDNRLGGFGAIAVIVGLVMLLELPGIGIPVILVGGYLLYKWLNSESSYFEFRGTGLLTKEPDKWRIIESTSEDPDEVREFVRTVRGRLE